MNPRASHDKIRKMSVPGRGDGKYEGPVAGPSLLCSGDRQGTGVHGALRVEDEERSGSR